ncbi:PREDICTED: myeloma-overexpressed gene 2 protein homolog isoform X3 [Bactrocera latifrons]|uniref:myeloma-overexpressed gene 2 protein homolog isoform X3 n=1 Tax=Bactrocera latifrons TaxID=174628 RepID=UPI0008DCEB5E|nr:PREDICTED: myeloma-overexpressed gene 2 protein homolog isoform X3 [Bactrocera latifrons]
MITDEDEAAHNTSGSSSGLLIDLPTNEKQVHADFYNDFEELFDDDDDVPAKTIG